MAEVAVKKPANPVNPTPPEPHRSFSVDAFRPFREEWLRMMSPFTLMRELTLGLDRRFHDGAWSPAVECKRTNGDFIVTAELPGLTKDEVKVEVRENELVVEGERQHETTGEKDDFFRSERFYGRFLRTIPLPEGAKPEMAVAKLNNGVLEVRMPVAAANSTARTIPVEEVPK